MANPINPLDIFTTYTCHFELHASSNWEELSFLISQDEKLSTTRRKSNKTLLINTRKDAHQTIDNVRFTQVSNPVDATASLVALGTISMDITEPGGTFFAEKLRRHLDQYNVSSVTAGFTFGLKIFFVGRTPDNKIVEIQMPGILAMTLNKFDAKFDHKGGEYKLEFITTQDSILPSAVLSTPISKIMGYVNKTISIKAKTVAEAFIQLEEKLNENYRKTYETELKNDLARELKYSINNVGEWDGSLNLTSTTTYSKDEEMSLTFHPSEDIGSMIRKILLASKDINDIVSSSGQGLKRVYHPNCQIPTITPRYLLKSDHVEIAIDINKYVGGGNVYSFDFLFSEAGKNVDVLEFECRFPGIATQNWMNSLAGYSTELNANQTSRIPAEESLYYSQNVCHPDITRQRIESAPIERYTIPAKSGDVAFLNPTPRSERTGHIKMNHDSVPSVRRAIQTYADFSGAGGGLAQISFTIRGHLGLLSESLGYPDGSKRAFGATNGVWMEVNIKDQEGQPFYYQGGYLVISIDNIFSGGKFTQICTVQMVEDEEASNAQTSNDPVTGGA